MKDIDIYAKYAEEKYEHLLLAYKKNKTKEDLERYKELEESISQLKDLIFREAMKNQGYEWWPIDIDGHPGSIWKKRRHK